MRRGADRCPPHVSVQYLTFSFPTDKIDIDIVIIVVGAVFNAHIVYIADLPPGVIHNSCAALAVFQLLRVPIDRNGYLNSISGDSVAALGKHGYLGIS